MDAVLRALADPTRRCILDLIASSEMAAGELARHFDVSHPAVSQHLAVLREAGLVEVRKDGTSRFYRARPAAMTPAKLFMEAFWDERLRQLAAATGEPPLIPEQITIEKEVLLAAPISDVWKLLTAPDMTNKWIGVSASIHAVVGGPFRVEIVPGNFAVGEVLEVDKPHVLSHTWSWEGDRGSSLGTASTTVTWTLIPTATGTLLHLAHRSLPDMNSATTHGNGWNHYLERLSRLAAGRRVPKDPWVDNPSLMIDQLHAREATSPSTKRKGKAKKQ